VSVFERVREFVTPRAPLARDRDGEYPDLDLWVATAVVLLEVAYGDYEFGDGERKAIRQSLQREFGILRRDAEELMETAERTRASEERSWIGRQIRERYDAGQRQRVLALIWKVVLADGTVTDFESVFAGHAAKLAELSPEQAAEARAMAERGEV
jgi:uncharacterized tellurite resistance protein B-like protein